MSASDLTAGTVMSAAASLLNDTARTVYSYASQVPYINIALRELQEYYQLHDIDIAQLTSSVIQVNAGVTEIIYNAAGTATNPALPDDMIEPEQVWERARDTDPFVPMTRKEYLPHSIDGVTTSQFIYFVWQDQKIIVPEANRNNDIKIDYVKELFAPVTDENSQINVVNAATFLEYRTAALCAEFIERNLPSANALNAYALMAMDRATGISIKGKQSITTRRRPFRAGYKKRGWVT
jgi:hypothetical protein